MDKFFSLLRGRVCVRGREKCENKGKVYFVNMRSCETIQLIDGLGYLRFQYLFDSSNAIFVEQ